MEFPNWLEETIKAHSEWFKSGPYGRRLIRDRTGLTEYKARQARDILCEFEWDIPRLMLALSGAAPGEEADEVIDLSASESKQRSRYWYDKDRGLYVFILQSAPRPVVLEESRVSEIVARYSNWDGTPSTINEIARDFTLNRAWVVELLRVLGVTHDSEPFTAERIAESSVIDLVEEALSARRAKLHLDFEKAKWEDIKRAADKHFEGVEALKAVAAGLFTSRPPKVKPLQLSPASEPYALLIGLTDFHFGMYAWRGETRNPYSVDEAYRRLDAYVDELVSETVVAFGAPEKIIVTGGSDFFHVDGDFAKTTKGTPQDLSITPTQVLVEGCRLNDLLIHKLLSVGVPIEMPILMSNHGRHNDLALMLYLIARYQDHDSVSIVDTCEPRVYLRYGTNALAFHHGDMLNARAMVDCFVTEEAELWGSCPNRYIFCGHLHQLEIREVGGAMSCLMPSLAGSDRWHTRAGYVTARPALSGYRITRDGGMRQLLYSTVQTHVGHHSARRKRSK